MHDIYEPLAEYRDKFKAVFAQNAARYFDSLAAAANVDKNANRELAAKVKKLSAGADSKRNLRCLLWWGVAICAAGVAAAAYFAYEANAAGDTVGCAKRAFAGVAALAAAIAIYLEIRRKNREIEALDAEIGKSKSICYQQMEPLNRSYSWGIPEKLALQTVPRLALDPFFSARRLEDLKKLFDWTDDFNSDKSILHALSGAINSNPFVICEYLAMWWGEKTYTGSKTIHWTERERDSQGRMRTVSRSQTLYASVTKPFPEYGRSKLVIYGNDAAPNLSFSREPFGDHKSIAGKVKKWWRIGSLKRFSRNLEDDSNYTIMSNHDFEARFCTKDRTNEVEYRLLFTPLAQRQMMALLDDTDYGFGDDFSFAKAGRINILHSTHLDGTLLEIPPSAFQHWCFDDARENFLAINCEFFRSFYFAMAPILAIPLYQQTRTHEAIYASALPETEKASFWECEATANFRGEKHFAHPQSVTQNILKARHEENGTVTVTAHGHRSVKHTEYISKLGGDGNWHDVRVDWVEYIPVERTSHFHISEGQAPESTQAASPDSLIHHRSIYSWF